MPLTPEEIRELQELEAIEQSEYRQLSNLEAKEKAIEDRGFFSKAIDYGLEVTGETLSTVGSYLGGGKMVNSSDIGDRLMREGNEYLRLASQRRGTFDSTPRIENPSQQGVIGAIGTTARNIPLSQQESAQKAAFALADIAGMSNLSEGYKEAINRTKQDKEPYNPEGLAAEFAGVITNAIGDIPGFAATGIPGIAARTGSESYAEARIDKDAGKAESLTRGSIDGFITYYLNKRLGVYDKLFKGKSSKVVAAVTEGAEEGLQTASRPYVDLVTLGEKKIVTDEGDIVDVISEDGLIQQAKNVSKAFMFGVGAGGAIRTVVDTLNSGGKITPEQGELAEIEIDEAVEQIRVEDLKQALPEEAQQQEFMDFQELQELEMKESGQQVESTETIFPDENTSIDTPELMSLIEGLGGQVLAAKLGKNTRGTKNDIGIKINRELGKDPVQLSKTMAHEIGHWIDSVPDGITKRGNILGRIASFGKSYKKHLLGKEPIFQENVITSKERIKIRNSVANRVRKSMGKDADPKAVNDAISEQYRSEINKEVEKRNLVTNNEIRSELINLSKNWRNWRIGENPNYDKYRSSSEELYADALSVLLNNEKALEDNAPKFYDSLMGWASSKPEVWELYEESVRAKDSGKIYDDLDDALVKGFKRGDKARARKEDKVGLWQLIKTGIWDQYAPLKGYIESGDSLPVLGAIKDMNYAAAEGKQYALDFKRQVLDPIKELGLKQNDVGLIMIYRRISKGDRQEIINTKAITPKRAALQLENLEKKIGADRMVKINALLKDFAELRNRSVISRAEELDAWDREFIDKIRDNENYAKFDVVDYLDKKHGAGTGLKVYESAGSFKDIDNPLVATVYKDMQLITAFNRNHAKRAVGEAVLKSKFGTISKKDGFGIVEDTRELNKKTLKYMKNGKMQGVDMPKELVDMFDRIDDVSFNGIANFLSYANIPFRNLFINLNPMFWLFDTFRDLKGTIIRNPGTFSYTFAKNLAKGVWEASKEELGKQSEIIDDMRRKKLLVSVVDPSKMTGEDIAIDRLLQSVGIQESQDIIMSKIRRLYEIYTTPMRIKEVSLKVAGREFLKSKGFDDVEIARRVRERFGSPDFLAKGKLTPLTNQIFMFSNAAKEGMRADIGALRDNPFSTGGKMFVASIASTALKILALAGILGTDYKKIYERVSEFDLANYDIFPFGFDLTENGKAEYLILPKNELGRAISGTMYKLFSGEDLSQVLDYMSGQAPTLSPPIKMAIDTLMYASGHNPYDSFRGKPALREDVFEANDDRTRKEFLLYLYRNSGLSLFYRPDDPYKEEAKSTIQEILQSPGYGKFFGRFVKSTDYGIGQKVSKSLDEVRQDMARSRLTYESAIKKYIAGEELTKEEMIELSVKSSNVFNNHLQKLHLKKHGSTFAQQWARARTLKEKMAVYDVFRKLEEQKTGE